MRQTAIAAAALAALTMGVLVAQQPTPRATITQGVLEGTTDNGVSVFLGVPYAAPPVGDRRWTPPEPAVGWGTMVRPAKAFGASCIQTLNPNGSPSGPWTSEYMTPAEPGTSEDCLFANIWTPASLTGSTRPAATLPVFLYIYGGGFNEGSGAVPVYNGVNLAKKGLVVVNINYRVGSLGFMAHPELTAEQDGASGNYGIHDQVAALRWVRDNIAAFGGDPAKVTIAGQSAGAMSVQALLASPLAKGLFRAAIVQSPAVPGAIGTFAPRGTAEQATVAAFGRGGLASMAAARALPGEQANRSGGRGGIVADGRLIPPTTARRTVASDVPMMTGYTLNDLFVSRAPVTSESWTAEARERYGDRAAEFLRYYPGTTDAEAMRSARREAVDRGFNLRLVDSLATSGATQPVYAYLFTHVEPGPESSRHGAFHTSEVPYEFNTLHLSPGRDFTDIDRRLAEQFSSYVANFVTTGDPNGGALPSWPAMTTANKAVLELGDRVSLTRAVPAGADAVISAGKPPAGPGRGGRGGAPAPTPAAR